MQRQRRNNPLFRHPAKEVGHTVDEIDDGQRSDQPVSRRVKHHGNPFVYTHRTGKGKNQNPRQREQKAVPERDTRGTRKKGEKSQRHETNGCTATAPHIPSTPSKGKIAINSVGNSGQAEAQHETEVAHIHKRPTYCVRRARKTHVPAAGSVLQSPPPHRRAPARLLGGGPRSQPAPSAPTPPRAAADRMGAIQRGQQRAEVAPAAAPSSTVPRPPQTAAPMTRSQRG